jgi:hypothetical protein
MIKLNDKILKCFYCKSYMVIQVQIIRLQHHQGNLVTTISGGGKAIIFHHTIYPLESTRTSPECMYRIFVRNNQERMVYDWDVSKLHNKIFCNWRQFVIRFNNTATLWCLWWVQNQHQAHLYSVGQKKQ